VPKHSPINADGAASALPAAFTSPGNTAARRGGGIINFGGWPDCVIDRPRASAFALIKITEDSRARAACNADAASGRLTCTARTAHYY